MRIITQEEYNSFEVVDGIKQCPTGDYKLITSFGAGSRFGAGSSFGAGSIFRAKTIIETKYNLIEMKKIDGIGSRNGCTYFFKCEEGLIVRCGCFVGTVKEFKQKVRDTYEQGTKHYDEYIWAINYISNILDLQEE